MQQKKLIVSGPTFTILTLLASLNSCVNPWVYLLFNPDLATLVKQQLLCRGRPHPVRRAIPGGGSNSSDSQGGGSSLRNRSRCAPHHPLLPPPRGSLPPRPVCKSFSDPVVRGLTASTSIVMIATSGGKAGQFV